MIDSTKASSQHQPYRYLIDNGSFEYMLAAMLQISTNFELTDSFELELSQKFDVAQCFVCDIQVVDKKLVMSYAVAVEKLGTAEAFVNQPPIKAYGGQKPNILILGAFSKVGVSDLMLLKLAKKNLIGTRFFLVPEDIEIGASEDAVASLNF